MCSLTQTIVHSILCIILIMRCAEPAHSCITLYQVLQVILNYVLFILSESCVHVQLIKNMRSEERYFLSHFAYSFVILVDTLNNERCTD